MSSGNIADPQLIVIDLNNRCNLSCKMCDVGTNNKEGLLYKILCPDEEVLTLDILEKFIDEIAGFKPQIMLGGPDFLLYKDVIPLVEYIVSKGLKIIAVTNGYLLPKHAERLASAPVDTIHVSLDGPPYIHNQIRGNDRSFQNAYAGLEIIVRSKEKKGQDRPLLNINYAIFNLNYFCINEFLDSLNKIPLNAICFRHMTYITEAMAHEHNKLHGDYLKAAKTCITDGEVEPRLVDVKILWEQMQKALKRNDYSIHFSPLLDEKGIHDYYNHPEKILGQTHCHSALQCARLRANGDIGIGHICFPLTMGNITEDTFDNIWNGEKFNKFRAYMANGLTPACTRCCAIT